jgi:hypothetical protein
MVTSSLRHRFRESWIEPAEITRMPQAHPLLDAEKVDID